jgi:hypothetical protein
LGFTTGPKKSSMKHAQRHAGFALLAAFVFAGCATEKGNSTRSQSGASTATTGQSDIPATGPITSGDKSSVTAVRDAAIATPPGGTWYAQCTVTGTAHGHPATWYSIEYSRWESADGAGKSHDNSLHGGADVHTVEKGPRK